MNKKNDYPIEIGQVIYHVNDPYNAGVVLNIDMDRPHPTTCTVRWLNNNIVDLHWTDRLMPFFKGLDLD